jgi:hypothetical protein
MMDISFVIVTFNSLDPVKICLESLYSSISDDLEYEIIISDNDSQDGTKQFIKENYPSIKLIENQTNLGYSKAMNQGLKVAKGKYLIQLNPDVKINPGTFQSLISWMNNHSDVGICIPKVLNQDGSFQKQCRRGFARPIEVLSYFLKLDRVFQNHKVIGNYVKTYLPEDEIAEVDAVSGSCMMIKRELIEDIGFLDERYFAYQEDTDFCFRANKAGWKVYYLPFVSVIHQGGRGGSRTSPYRGIFEWHRSYLLYYQKNLSKDYFFLINWIMYLMIGLKLIISLIGAIFSKEKVVGTRKP